MLVAVTQVERVITVCASKNPQLVTVTKCLDDIAKVDGHELNGG